MPGMYEYIVSAKACLRFYRVAHENAQRITKSHTILPPPPCCGGGTSTEREANDKLFFFV